MVRRFTLGGVSLGRARAEATRTGTCTSTSNPRQRHSTLYIHSTLYTPHSTLHTPHSTLHTPHSPLYTPHSTLYTPHSTLHTSHSTLYTLHFTLYTLHSTLRTLHFTLLTPHFTLHTPQGFCSIMICWFLLVPAGVPVLVSLLLSSLVPVLVSFLLSSFLPQDRGSVPSWFTGSSWFRLGFHEFWIAHDLGGNMCVVAVWGLCRRIVIITTITTIKVVWQGVVQRRVSWRKTIEKRYVSTTPFLRRRGQKSGALHQLISQETRVLQSLQAPFGGVDMAQAGQKPARLASETSFTREAGHRLWVVRWVAHEEVCRHQICYAASCSLVLSMFDMYATLHHVLLHLT